MGKIVIFDQNCNFLTKVVLFDQNWNFRPKLWTLTKIVIFDQTFDCRIKLPFFTKDCGFYLNHFWTAILFSVICHSGGQVIGAPTNNNRLVLTMRRDYYTKKKIIPTLTRLRLEVVQAGTVDPLTMQQSFNIWIHYNMAPKFCLMGTFLKLTYIRPGAPFLA